MFFFAAFEVEFGGDQLGPSHPILARWVNFCRLAEEFDLGKEGQGEIRAFIFFSQGEKMTDEKERSEVEWKKACEAELNFQKAVEMVTGCRPIKSEEDRQFMEKWIFYPSKGNESRKNINPRLHP